MIGLNGNLFMKNLTFAPQPKWKHIAKAFFATDKSDEKIIAQNSEAVNSHFCQFNLVGFYQMFFVIVAKLLMKCKIYQ